MSVRVQPTHTRRRPRLRDWDIPVTAASLGAGVGLILAVAARSPRAQANVMFVSMVTFMLLALWRTRVPPGSDSKTTPATSPGGLLLALAAALVAWSGTLGHFFLSDDFVHLYAVRQPLGSFLRRILLEGETDTFLRPVAFLTLWFDGSLWSDWMPGYHATNLLIHLGTVSGVFFCCRGTPRLRPLAGLAALLFGILPIHAEAIGWVGARFDLTSGLLVIWCVSFYIRYRERESVAWLWPALVLAALAFLAKENAYAIPILLVAVELFLLPHRRLIAVWPFALVLAATLVYRVAVLGSPGGYRDAAGGLEVFNLGFKTLEALLVRTPSLSLAGLNWLQAGWVTVLAPALAGLLLAIALMVRTDGRILAFACLWIAASALPAHALLLIGPSLMNSRILYLGTVGISILLASMLLSVPSDRQRNRTTILLGSLLILGSWHNTAAWKHTSDQARQFLREVAAEAPAPSAGSQYVFHGMPEAIRGVHFMRVSMTEPLWWTFDRDDITGYRVEALDEAPGDDAIHFDWVGEDGRLVRRR